MIGSEGTLGLVVEVTLRLTDPPRSPQVMVMAVPDMHGGDAGVFRLFRERLSLTAFEFFTDRALAHVLAHGGKRPFESEAPCYVLVEYEAPGRGRHRGRAGGVRAGGRARAGRSTA